MAGKWSYKRVEEIALKVAMGPFGSSIKVETFTDTGIPIISGQHLREAELTDSEFNFITEEHADSLKNANVQRGDVIFTHAGNIGQVAFIPNHSKYQRYVISQRQFYLRCDTSIILPEFVVYYFKSPEGQHKLLANANQVGVPSIARPSSYLKTIEVPVPSIEEQQIVVRNIKALDAKIRANRRINQTLEAMTQAIFKSWFVDFDPVKAKIAAIEQGQDPLRAAMRAISGKTDAELDQMPREHHDPLAATAALFPDAMEESELGEIPKGWETAPLSKMIRLIGGGTPKRSESNYWGGTIPWFSVKDVPNDGDVWVIDTDEKITELGLQKSSTKLLHKGTTIISARGTVGKLAMVGQEMAMNQSCYGVVGTGGIGDFFNYFNLKFTVETLKRNTHGAVFDTITQATFETVTCVKPENSVMKQFDETVEPLLKSIRSNVFQSRELADLRDTLLPKLLSGELSVAETKKQVNL